MSSPPSMRANEARIDHGHVQLAVPPKTNSHPLAAEGGG